MSVVSAPDGVRIAYDVQGAGPPIVLVHGITESRRSWDPLVPGLAESHLVVAVDLRGHGESERRPPYDALTMAIDLDAVVTDAGAAGPLVVGHSLGAAVASLFASMYPARGVVNIDQSLELASFKQLIAPLEPQLRADEATFLSAMEAIFEPLYGALPAAERARIDGPTHPEQDVVLGVWQLVLDTSPADLDALARGAAVAISAPYLALHGIDPGRDYVGWLTSLVPGASVEIWPGLGHYPHLVEPGRFLDRVRDFDRLC